MTSCNDVEINYQIERGDKKVVDSIFTQMRDSLQQMSDSLCQEYEIKNYQYLKDSIKDKKMDAVAKYLNH